MANGSIFQFSNPAGIFPVPTTVVMSEHVREFLAQAVTTEVRELAAGPYTSDRHS